MVFGGDWHRFGSCPCEMHFGTGQANLDELVKSRHPVEKRGPAFCNSMKTLDSGFRRNDEKRAFGTFYESINLSSLTKGLLPLKRTWIDAQDS
jgi:hypothetical protein